MSEPKTKKEPSVKKTAAELMHDAKAISKTIEEQIAESDFPNEMRMLVIKHLEANVPPAPPQSEVANSAIEMVKVAALEAGLDPEAVLREISHKVTVPVTTPEQAPQTEPTTDKKGARK